MMNGDSHMVIADHLIMADIIAKEFRAYRIIIVKKSWGWQ